MHEAGKSFMAGLEGVGAHIIGLNLGLSDSLLLLRAPHLDLEEQGHRQNVDWFNGDIKLAMDPTQSVKSLTALGYST